MLALTLRYARCGCLIPWHDAEAVPRLDDAAVPIFGPQWLALREDWLIRREGRVADGVA